VLVGVAHTRLGEVVAATVLPTRVMELWYRNERRLGRELHKHENCIKMTKKQPPRPWFSTCQVGAFCVFWPGYTETPFIFCPFFVFFRKIARFRG